VSIGFLGEGVGLVSESVMPKEPDDEMQPVIVPLEHRPHLPSWIADSCDDAAKDSPVASDLDVLDRSSLRPRRFELADITQGEDAARIGELVGNCVRAYKEGNRQMLNRAFKELSRRATRLLLSQAWGLPQDEREAQAQQILLELFEAIKKDKAGFAQSHFAAFAKRKAISLYRKRCARFEGANNRIEPSKDNTDPLVHIPTRIPGVEVRALLECAEDRLPDKLREVFIQYHHFEMTLEEVANQHGVTVRTIYNWLKKAEAAIGYAGETHARR
jgi:DNA-directed RNA polymerase specialized sigma24 family protein